MDFTKNLLFVGEDLVRSSPSRVLAQALTKHGYKCVFSEDADLKSPHDWKALISKADAVIVVAFWGPKTLRVRQLALAAEQGRPIVRWWVGTDVLRALTDHDVRRGSLLLNKFSAANVAVAEHLVDELRSIGIRSDHIPSIPAPLSQAVVNSGRPPKAVLVYLPGRRLDFYRVDIVARAASDHPDLLFIIVGDDGHALGNYANVESLGWIDDLDPVWSRVGLLLRMTKHDGLPRMVLDALLRGKYVIYSWPLPGCWRATEYDHVREGLTQFRQTLKPNEAGRQAILQWLNPHPSDRFARLIESVIRNGRTRNRLAGALMRIRLDIRMRIRWAGS